MMKLGLCLLLGMFLSTGCLVLHPQTEWRQMPSGEISKITISGELKGVNLLQVSWDGGVLVGQQSEKGWIGDLPKGIDWHVPHRLKVVTNNWKRETQVPPPDFVFHGEGCDVSVEVKNETFNSIVLDPCLFCIALPYVLVTDGWPG